MRTAIQNKDIDTVKCMIETDPEKLNMQLPTGSWLSMAISCEADEIIEYFLDINIDLSITNEGKSKENVINTAAAYGTPEMIMQLHDAGAEIHYEKDEQNPIWNAFYKENVSTFQFLIKMSEENMSKEDFQMLYDGLCKAAVNYQKPKMQSALGFALSKQVCVTANFSREKLKNFFKKGIIKFTAKLIKEYQDKHIYGMSLEIDKDSKACFFYINTKEDYKEKIAGGTMGASSWYYYFCTYEWNLIEETPKFFKDATEYMLDEAGDTNMMDLYDCYVAAIQELINEECFRKLGCADMVMLINANDIYDKEELIEIFKIINTEESVNDIILHIDDFY